MNAASLMLHSPRHNPLVEMPLLSFQHCLCPSHRILVMIQNEEHLVKRSAQREIANVLCASQIAQFTAIRPSP